MRKGLALVGAGLAGLGVILWARRAKAAPAPPPPPPGLANVYGRVTLATTGEALPGVAVKLANIGTSRATETDANGDYGILDIEPGLYTMTFKAEGAKLLFRPVSLQEGNNEANAALVPLEVPTPPPPPPPGELVLEIPLGSIPSVNGKSFAVTGAITETEMSKYNLPNWTSQAPYGILTEPIVLSRLGDLTVQFIRRSTYPIANYKGVRFLAWFWPAWVIDPRTPDILCTVTCGNRSAPFFPVIGQMVTVVINLPISIGYWCQGPYNVAVGMLGIAEDGYEEGIGGFYLLGSALSISSGER